VPSHALLEARDIGVQYGGVRAVDGVSITVEAGQVVGLIGPNGAGKTSFIDAITGFTRSTGSVRLDGEELSHLSPAERARRGMARTWQAVELFDDLTVGENLAVASRPAGLRGRSRGEDRAAARDILATLGLADAHDKLPSELSHGQRKLTGIARALSAQPKLLLADEPAAGLDTGESTAFAGRLRRVAERGVGVLLIDHDMGLVLSVCDYVYVIEFGCPLAEGTPAQIRTDPAVITAYLGTEVPDAVAEEVAG
jgi:ABC-type branched-subunit amino acid transport system ATPase component